MRREGKDTHFIIPSCIYPGKGKSMVAFMEGTQGTDLFKSFTSVTIFLQTAEEFEHNEAHYATEHRGDCTGKLLYWARKGFL